MEESGYNMVKTVTSYVKAKTEKGWKGLERIKYHKGPGRIKKDQEGRTKKDKKDQEG